MGNKWISPNEFSQMIGRAGRPTYHDRGVVYLLPEIANKFDNESEESVAISLLESDVENVHIEYSEEELLEQVLADVCSHSLKDIETIHSFYKNIKIPIDLEMTINELYDKKLIRIINKNNKEEVIPTKYGKAVSMSFLSVQEGSIIKKIITKIKSNLEKRK